jgi:hypothetical protein
VLSVIVPVTAGLRPVKLKAVNALAVEVTGVVVEFDGDPVGDWQVTRSTLKTRGNARREQVLRVFNTGIGIMGNLLGSQSSSK